MSAELADAVRLSTWSGGPFSRENVRGQELEHLWSPSGRSGRCPIFGERSSGQVGPGRPNGLRAAKMARVSSQDIISEYLDSLPPDQRRSQTRSFEGCPQYGVIASR